jgi:hypothetical protein
MRRKTSFLTSDKEAPKPKDCWDILDVLSKALVPILLLSGGFFFNSTLSKIGEDQNNARTAVQLQNGRESTETVLRGNMFSKILEKYNKVDDAKGQLLYLELLVENFSQSLDLTPMIKEVKRNIVAQKDNEERTKMLSRLAMLLNSAKSKQLASISTDGAIKRFILSKPDKPYVDTVLQFCEKGTSVARRIPLRVSVSDVNIDELTANVQLARFTRIGGGLHKEISEVSVEPSDLPLIDNIRIAPGVRLSLSPTAINSSSFATASNTKSIGISLTAFPDEISSVKEPPVISSYLDSINQLQTVNKELGPSEDPRCQATGRKLAFVEPETYEFEPLPLSN